MTTPDPAPDAAARRDSAAAPTDAAIGAARARNDRLLLRALLIAVAAGLVIDAVVILVAVLAGGDGAVAGALVGSGLALVVTLPTLGSALASRRLDPTGWAMVLMGSWMVKMFVLIIALLLLRDASWLSRPWLGVALLAGAIVAAVTEAVGMMRGRPRLEVAEAAPERPGED